MEKKSRRVLCFASDSQFRRERIHRFARINHWDIEFRPPLDPPPTSWRGDGVLALQETFCSENGRKLLACLKRRRTPIVVLEGNPLGSPFPCVAGDDLAIGRLAAEHFNERRYPRAAFFSHYNQPVSQQGRLEGFLDGWRGQAPEVWLWSKVVGPEDLEDQGKIQAWLIEKLNRTPKPVAVFAWNDFDAYCVINACVEAQISVPAEVAILGVDNHTDICEHTTVKLSSIQHHLTRIGHVGAAMLDRLMSGRPLDRETILIKPHGIVCRASTELLATFSPEVRDAIAYMDANLSRPLGAAKIAAALKIPRPRLDYLFKVEVGSSVGKLIGHKRIERAKHLLSTTEESVEAIAAACGYCNVSFFAKHFRRAANTTPLTWRKRQQNIDFRLRFLK